jgi:polysaccharide pyruvyl transferase WcaK-like protein
VVTLRDQGSYQLLKEAGFNPGAASETRVEVFADPAFGLPTSLPQLREAEELLGSWGIPTHAPLLGVNVRYWDRPHPPEVWVPRVARGLEGFLAEKEDLEVLLIPFQISDESIYTDDFAVCERLRAYLRMDDRVHFVSGELSPGTAQALIGRCSLLLGMRYHALVMAMAERVPAVALPYDLKVSHLMTEAGLDAFCPSSYAPPPEALHEVLGRAWEERAPLAQRLDTIAKEMAPKAQASANLAARLLARSSLPPDVGLLQDVALGWVKALEEADRRLEELREEDRVRGGGSGGVWKRLLSWGREIWHRARGPFQGRDEGS